jgi:hypothetical protein
MFQLEIETVGRRGASNAMRHSVYTQISLSLTLSHKGRYWARNVYWSQYRTTPFGVMGSHRTSRNRLLVFCAVSATFCHWRPISLSIYLC